MFAAYLTAIVLQIPCVPLLPCPPPCIPLVTCPPPEVPIPGDTPPVMGKLRVTVRTKTTVTIEWSKATDDKGIIGYRLYQDHKFLTSSGASSVRARFGLPCGRHRFIVEAVDNRLQRTAAAIIVRRRC